MASVRADQGAPDHIRKLCGDAYMSQSVDQMVRSLALAMRDKALADARQAMKLVREIERQYGLTPASTKGER